SPSSPRSSRRSSFTSGWEGATAGAPRSSSSGSSSPSCLRGGVSGASSIMTVLERDGGGRRSPTGARRTSLRFPLARPRRLAHVGGRADDLRLPPAGVGSRRAVSLSLGDPEDSAREDDAQVGALSNGRRRRDD